MGHAYAYPPPTHAHKWSQRSVQLPHRPACTPLPSVTTPSRYATLLTVGQSSGQSSHPHREGHHPQPPQRGVRTPATMFPTQTAAYGRYPKLPVERSTSTGNGCRCSDLGFVTPDKGLGEQPEYQSPTISHSAQAAWTPPGEASPSASPNHQHW